MIQVKIFYRKFMIDSDKNRNQEAVWNCFQIIPSISRSWDTSLCYTSFGVKDPVPTDISGFLQDIFLFESFVQKE